MINVVIDSNIVIANFHLKYAAFDKFCRYFPERNIEVFICKVSIEEIFKNFKQRLSEESIAFNKSVKAINNIRLDNIEQFNSTKIEKEFNDYKLYFLELVKKNRIKILPYPAINHESIVRYSVTGKKPFKTKDTGYKDFLIWNSVVELLKTNSKDVVIITKDSDFIDNSAIAKDFIDYLKIHDIKPERLTLLSSFNELNVKYIDDIVEKVDILKYFEDSHNEEKFIKFIVPNLENQLQGIDLGGYAGVELPREFEDPSITSASYSYYHEIDDIEIYNDDFYIIRLTMHFDCEVQIFIFKPDLYLLDEDDMPTIVDNDWNDHYILAYDNMNLSVDFSIMINKKLDNIKQIDVNLIRK